jgi:hypothetical protein
MAEPGCLLINGGTAHEEGARVRARSQSRTFLCGGVMRACAYCRSSIQHVVLASCV